MDLLHDFFDLPGAVTRGLGGTGHARTDSQATDTTTGTVQPTQSASILTPLRRLLRASRDPGERNASSPAIPETPQNPTTERPENTGYRIQVLKVKLDQAVNYSEWLTAATELDELEGHDTWKLEDESPEYDVELVRQKLKQMDDTRISRDQRQIFMLIRTGLTRNLGGMGNLRLYKHSRIGTKAMIERYIESALETIDTLVDITKNGHGPMDSTQVLQDLLLTRQSFGRSALLLSGGGTFGMNHIGVIKCLYEANLLPRIISGASAGSIVSAVLCSKTDDEIPTILQDFCYGDLAVFEKEGAETSLFAKAYRFLTQGSLFDITNLINVMKGLLGDMTFQEAYNRTRRILNICVSTASLFELPVLLNYITAPNVLIWSAVAASCSVPFVFTPAQLLMKDPRTGQEVPWTEGGDKFIDGSVENDIPMDRLSEMFNVNHFIVSQVNPHVVPFLEKNENDVAKAARRSETRHTAATSLGQRMTKLARGEAMHRLQILEEAGILPNVLSKVRSVVGQRYSGDITIFPHVSYANFPYVLSNPTSDFMLDATLSGERATWPKLSEIRNHCAIELAIDDAVHQLMSCVAFGPCQLDMHSLATLGFPLTMSAQKTRRLTRRPMYRTLRTSLDLPRLSLRGPSTAAAPPAPMRSANGTRFSLGGTAPRHARKEAGPDLHEFSGSESDVDDEDEGTWDLSGDGYSDDSSGESPPSPQASIFPSVTPLFPWASQPATPSILNRPLSITPVTKADTPMTMSGPLTAVPSSPELHYKRLFHQGPIKDLTFTSTRQRSRSTHEPDVSGARSMAMRKMSLNIGQRTPGGVEAGPS